MDNAEPERSIAVVDDDDGVSASLASLLRSFGFAVKTYSSGTDFLEHGSPESTDCIITDIQMPSLRGDELQARLIELNWTVPMIFMTAFPTEATRSRVMNAGGVAFLEKPADSALLVGHVQAALARHVNV